MVPIINPLFPVVKKKMKVHIKKSLTLGKRTFMIKNMKLKEYLELKKVRPYLWARDVGLPQSGVYAWLAGTIRPNIENVMHIKVATEGAVGPEDWVNEE